MTAHPQRLRQEQLLGLDQQLLAMQPLLRQMHLLSSNAVSAAARAGSEGDAFRVLTQAIQQLGQEINTDIQQCRALLAQCLSETGPNAELPSVSQIKNSLSAMPQAVKKGEYLAIFCAVEAAHTERHAERFDAVATMLKQLVEHLREQTAQQQRWLEELDAPG